MCCQAIINNIKTLEQTPAVLKNRPKGDIPTLSKKSPNWSQQLENIKSLQIYYLKI